MNVSLLIPSLQFVLLGAGLSASKVHARQTGMSPSGVDMGGFTLCGRDLPAVIELVEERSMPISRLCGRCYASLRTFGRDKVRIGG